MKKITRKTGVFLTVLLSFGTFVVVGVSFINKKTETFGSNPQPEIETKTNNQPYQISGTVKVSL